MNAGAEDGEPVKLKRGQTIWVVIQSRWDDPIKTVQLLKGAAVSGLTGPYGLLRWRPAGEPKCREDNFGVLLALNMPAGTPPFIFTTEAGGRARQLDLLRSIYTPEHIAKLSETKAVWSRDMVLLKMKWPKVASK